MFGYSALTVVTCADHLQRFVIFILDPFLVCNGDFKLGPEK